MTKPADDLMDCSHLIGKAPTPRRAAQAPLPPADAPQQVNLMDCSHLMKAAPQAAPKAPEPVEPEPVEPEQPVVEAIEIPFELGADPDDVDFAEAEEEYVLPADESLAFSVTEDVTSTTDGVEDAPAQPVVEPKKGKKGKKGR